MIAYSESGESYSEMVAAIILQHEMANQFVQVGAASTHPQKHAHKARDQSIKSLEALYEWSDTSHHLAPTWIGVTKTLENVLPLVQWQTPV